jgi:hypothetical protein
VLLAPYPGEGDRSPLPILQVRYMGLGDDSQPNNEFVTIALDTRYSNGNILDLSGFKLKNDAGDIFTFPAGFSITAAQNVRIHTGTGTNSTADLYWNRANGVWKNAGDCAYLMRPSGSVLYRVFWGNSRCNGFFGTASVYGMERLACGEPESAQ